MSQRRNRGRCEQCRRKGKGGHPHGVGFTWVVNRSGARLRVCGYCLSLNWRSISWRD